MTTIISDTDVPLYKSTASTPEVVDLTCFGDLTFDQDGRIIDDSDVDLEGGGGRAFATPPVGSIFDCVRCFGEDWVKRRDRGIAKVNRGIDVCISTVNAFASVLNKTADPFVELARPIVIEPVKYTGGVVAVVLGGTVSVAQTAVGVTSDAVVSVCKLFQRRDDDIATQSQDVMGELCDFIVDDEVMKGEAMVDERVVREFDGDKTGKRKRSKWSRGKLLLVSETQVQFPQRMDGSNPQLVARQIYEYMLRRANTLGWSVQDKADLPSLAAFALAPGPSDNEARKVLYSKLREDMHEEYSVSGSRYPFAKRLFRRLRFWA